MTRFLRHIIAPLVAYFVANGYLPKYAQGDVTEAFVIGAGFLIAYGWSWVRDRKRETKPATGQGGKNV